MAVVILLYLIKGFKYVQELTNMYRTYLLEEWKNGQEKQANISEICNEFCKQRESFQICFLF